MSIPKRLSSKQLFFYLKGDCDDNGKEATCTCRDGYSGHDCTTKGCGHLQNCNNHGNCFFEKGVCKTDTTPISCECAVGWKGNNCGTVDCGNSQCKNGGKLMNNIATCNANGGIAKPCECKPGWKGLYCDEATCDDNYNPCNGHGIFIHMFRTVCFERRKTWMRM